MVDSRLGRKLDQRRAERSELAVAPERRPPGALGDEGVRGAERLIGVQLTGMGNDGAEAMTRAQGAGGRTIAERESAAIVFGMPGELIRRGGADHRAVRPDRPQIRQRLGRRELNVKET